MIIKRLTDSKANENDNVFKSNNQLKGSISFVNQLQLMTAMMPMEFYSVGIFFCNLTFVN